MSATALWACPAVTLVPASSREICPARAKLTWLDSSARSTVRRLPESPSMSSNGANTRPHSRHPTCQHTSSTVPAAVCSFRRRVRLPLRAKSSAFPQRGHANGAGRFRTGAHRGPHTESINRSCASASVASTARNGTSRDICTASDSNSAHDERASSTPGLTVSDSVVADMG